VVVLMLKTLLLVLICFPVNAKAGWLLWEAPAYIPPPAGEKEIRSAEAAPPFIPPAARMEGKQAAELELDAIFEAGTGELRDFMSAAGFEETPYGFKRSFFAALTQLFSARLPTRFPPAQKWLAGGRPQDLSFIRIQASGRTAVYLWRLPCRTKKAPLWAAGARAPGGKDVWDGLAGNTKKSRALELKARPAGKTLRVFTLP